MTALRVQLIHGLEGSPTGAKAQYLGRHFELRAPAMNTGDFRASVRAQAEALREFAPEVLVGSSFGGGVAVALLESGDWRGPTVLLAPAVGYVGVAPVLPAGVPVTIVHGTRDDVVPIEDSRALARSGTPSLVTMLEVDDEHRLSSLLDGDRLAKLVRDVAARRPR